MAYDFSASPLDAIISGIGDPNNFVKNKLLSRFDAQRRISDLNVLRTYKRNAPFCVDLPMLQSTLGKIEIPTQPLYVDYFGRSVSTTPDTLQQNNFGGGKTQRYQVVIGNPLVEKMTISRENLARWDFMGSNNVDGVLAQKWAAVKMNAFMEMYMSLLEKLESASYTHLNSVLSTGGGAGTVYPAGAINTDTKEIPLADKDNKYNGIFTEAMQNRFLYGDNELDLLSSTASFMDFNYLKSLGANNASDQTATQLSLFNFIISNSLDAGVDATYSSDSYLVKRGGVGIETYAQPMGDDNTIPEMAVANKKFSTFEVPDIGSAFGIDVAKGIGGMKVSYYEDKDVIDSNATYATEESFLNKEVNMTLWTRPVFLVAQSEVAGDTPVVKFGQLKA